MREVLPPSATHTAPFERRAKSLSRVLFLFLFLATFALDASAPASISPSPAPASSWMFGGRWSQLAEPVFQNFGPENPLVQNSVYAFAQDGDGYLWIGTEWGLSRWDGYRARIYSANAKDPHALPNSYIYSMFTAADGTLWIGTRGGGLARYDRDNDWFINYPIGKSGFPYSTVYAIADDGAGRLLIATGSGDGDGQLDLLDPKTGKISTVLSGNGEDGILSDARVHSLLVDHDGTLWVGTLSGLLKREKGQTRFVDVPLPSNVSGAPRVYALYETRDHTIWIGTSRHGVFYLSKTDAWPKQLVDISVDSIGFARDFLEPVSGELWIAFASEGIAVVDTQSLQVRHIHHDSKLPHSLRDDLTLKLFQDRSGLVWVGSGTGPGIYNPQSAILTVFGDAAGRRGLPSSWISVLLPTTDGHVWMGSIESGIDIVDPSTGTVRNMPISTFGSGEIGGMVEVSKKVFVVSHQGLYRIDLDGKNVTHFSLEPRSALSMINNLWADDKTIWIEGYDGMWKLSGDSVPSAPIERAAFSEKLSDQVQTVAVRQSPTRLWVGTENGLNRVDIDTQSVLALKPDPADDASLASPMISTLLIDREHRLWVGTPAGIDVLISTDEPGRPRFRHFADKDGMPAAILSILQASDGTIWASTSKGITVIDPNTYSTRQLQRADGVITPFKIDNAGAETAQGELLFGGVDGVTVVRPQRMEKTNFAPPIVVTDLRIGNKIFPSGRYNDGRGMHDPIVIEPGAGNLTVEFAALDYSAPERLQYAYRLDGYDREWIASDATRRTANYTDLPPGDFYLHMRGSNREGIWSKREIVVPIRVLPPWYRTLWAFAMYVILFAAALWLAGAWRVRRAERATRRLETTVAERTTALATANAQLEDARQSAEEATRAKSAFLANMSHEIRTPMNAVLGFAQLGLRQPLSPKTLTYLDKIVNAGKNLLGILNDILDFSKIESGRLVLERTPFDIQQTLDQLRDLFSVKAAEQRIDFSVACDAGVPEPLLGDPLRLSQVLINLVGNALKFTRDGFVRVNVTLQHRTSDAVTLHFAIEDSGIGMDDAQLAQLFVPFSQADSSTTRIYGGTGLGLTISQRIVEPMGGRIDVRSVPGRGSVCAFDASFGVASVTGEIHRAISNQAQERSIAGARVLLAEDNPINQELAKEILGAAGAIVVLAATGDEAVHLATQEYFDCILMDIQMPTLDGYAATALIRRHTARNRVPIIAITAHASDSHRLECLAAGMDDYVTKPIDARILIDTVKRWTDK